MKNKLADKLLGSGGGGDKEKGEDGEESMLKKKFASNKDQMNGYNFIKLIINLNSFHNIYFNFIEFLAEDKNEKNTLNESLSDV